jgi:predicted nucleic acid-binding protein
VSERILLDTGPLVALLNRRDAHHDWAVVQWGRLRPPLLTCEAVLSEACFLLRQYPPGGRAVLELLSRGVVEVRFRLDEEVEAVSRQMHKYRDVPMSLADACLVRMSELVPASAVLTLDSDFKRYRRQGRRVVPTIMPGRE